jgi:hypothetical protein
MTTYGPSALAPGTRARCASWTLCLPLRARGCTLEALIASVGAVVAGFIVTALASTAVDAVMHAAGIFPSAPQLMSDPLFALAAAYRALFTVAGGYVTARLAPDEPMRHAWILAGIGLFAGLAGVVAYYTIGGAELGPA